MLCPEYVFDSLVYEGDAESSREYEMRGLKAENGFYAFVSVLVGFDGSC